MALGGGAQVSPAALDPHHGNGLAGERVFLTEFGRGIAATGVGDPLVRAQEVGAVDQACDGVERSGLGADPMRAERAGGCLYESWWVVVVFGAIGVRIWRTPQYQDTIQQNQVANHRTSNMTRIAGRDGARP